MAWIVPAISAIGSIIGGNQQNHAASAAAGAAQQQQQQVADFINQMMPYISGMMQQGQQYQSIMPGVLPTMQSLTGDVGQTLPGAYNQFEKGAISPQQLAQITGINAPGAVGGAMSYLGAPGSTNLATATPGALQFYQNQMREGIDPRFASNAQDQLQQGFQRSLGALDQSTAPGANKNTQRNLMQDQLLQQSANLGGQLAGESQQLAGQGAQGALGAASGLDAQKLQMLMQMAQLGMGFNQQAFENMGQGVNEGTSMLDQLLGFMNTGNQMQQGALGDMSGILSLLNNNANTALGLAGSMPRTNIFSSLGQGLAGMNFGGFGGGGGGPVNTSAVAPSPGGFGSSVLGAGINPTAFLPSANQTISGTGAWMNPAAQWSP